MRLHFTLCPPLMFYLCMHMPKYNSPIRSKLPKVGTTIFTIMSSLAKEQRAINLSQGFPGFPISTDLVKRVHHYMKKGYNQYAPMAGIPELLTAISRKMEALYSTYYHPKEEITVTAGATQAIFTAVTALCSEDDEVIIFTPAYDCYAPAVELAGAKPIYIQLNAPDYRIPWEEVKKVINRKTRMVMINSPHNPTGTIVSDEDMLELEKLTKDSSIIVLSDEVYEHIVFDDKEHCSAAKYPGLADRSIIVASFGKTFHATGWKMGYALGPAELMAEFRKVHQYNVFSCNTPIQYALCDHLDDESNYLSLSDFYQEKRDFFLNEIKDTAFNFNPAEGTYFQLLSYKNISTKRDTDLAIDWTKDFGIASIPVSVFYHQELDEHMLRFCFAKEESDLREAGEVLRKISDN